MFRVKLVSVWGGGAGGAVGGVSPAGGAERCAYGAGGRLLGAAGRHLSVYVTSLPPLCAAHGTRALALTNLAELTVYQCIAVPDEPELSKCENSTTIFFFFL